jgi:O-antigen/teichoic acid export membrane protein
VSGATATSTLLRSVVQNAVSLTAGRILIALLRFLVALVIVQRAGLERFGEFALLISFVMMAEWLSDFGLGDIAVREIAGDPNRRGTTLRAFAVCKVAQCALAGAAMIGAIALLGYSPAMLHSGLVASAAILFYGGVQYYRVEFRVEMKMARDAGAELISGLALLAGVWVATRYDAPLEGLALCYVISRAVNLAVAALLARGIPRPGTPGDMFPELGVLARAAAPLGLTGMMVSLYDAMDPIALSRWSTSGEIGIFSVAIRVVMLAVIAEQALAAATFPLLAARWANDRPAFAASFQAIFDAGTILAGALFVGLYAGAGAVATIFRQEPLAVAAVLQLLACAIFARAIVTLMSPLVLISGRLMSTVWISLLVVLAKGAALALLASHGAMGAATAYLIAEIVVGLVPTVLLCQRAAGVRLDWSIPVRVAALAAILAAASAWLDPRAGPVGCALAVVAYFALAWAIGAIRPEEVRILRASLARRGRSDA